jgi:hypothetical protein
MTHIAIGHGADTVQAEMLETGTSNLEFESWLEDEFETLEYGSRCNVLSMEGRRYLRSYDAQWTVHGGNVYLDGFYMCPLEVEECWNSVGRYFYRTTDYEIFEYYLDDVVQSEFVKWLHYKAVYTCNERIVYKRGLLWHDSKLYYADSQDVLCFENFTLTSRADFCYENRAHWIQSCIEAQSGSEKDFARSKYERKQSRRETAKTKCMAELAKLHQTLSGSKLANTRKNLKRKLAQCGAMITEESGFDPKLTLEMLEKAGGLFLMTYYDQPIFKALSAGLLLVRGSVSVLVYDTLMSFVSEFKDWKATLKEFVTWMKLVVLDVDKFKNNRFAKPFARLVSQMFSVFLCPDLNTKIKEVFSDNKVVNGILDFFGNEFHPLESVLHFVTYIANAVDLFVQTGELTGFVETQSVDDIIMSELREMRDAYGLFKTGDIEFVKSYKLYDFVKRLNELREKLVILRKARKAFDLKEIDNWIREVDSMVREVAVHNLHNSAKIQGYYMSISSGSGISKGHLMNLFANTVAASNNIPFSPEYHYSLNQANKFQSGWKNHTTIVKVDDAAAMRSTVTETLCLADWLIRGSNNVPHELLGADISEKGTLFNRSLVEVWSSNSFDMFFHEEARFSSALQRRFQVKFTARVKPAFTKRISVQGKNSSQIDYDQMPEDMRVEIAPDAWLFTAYVCQIVDEPMKVKTTLGAGQPEIDNDFLFVIPEYEGKPMKDVSIDVVLNFLREDSQRHFTQQQRVLEMAAKLTDKSNYCSHGLPDCVTCKECSKTFVGVIKKYKKDHSEWKEKVEKLRNRICKYESDKVKFLEARGKVFWKKSINELESVDRGKMHYCSPNYDYVHSHPWKIYDKAKLYKSTYVHDGVTYSVTKEVNVAALKDMPFGNLLLDPALIKEESSPRERVYYMKGLLEAIKSYRVDTSDMMKHAYNVVELGKYIKKSLGKTLQSWFDTFVYDVFMALVDRVVEYLGKVFEDPWKNVPAGVEGTVLGAYIHSKQPVLRCAMAVDWLMYKNSIFQSWLDNPYATPVVKPSYRLTAHIYRNGLPFMDPIATPKKIDRKRAEEAIPLTLEEFVLEGGRQISVEEKIRKSRDPQLLRDSVIPMILGCSAVMAFIPRLIQNISGLYIEEQVGHMVSVAQIKQLDKEESQNWYRAKQEIMLNQVKVSSIIKFTELENLINKNTFHVVNETTKERLCGFSPKNQFILLPNHFVERSIGHVLELTKVPHSSSPGNAKVKICLQQQSIFRMPGDLCLIYVAQLMDHMRTKDLVNYFPDAIIHDNCSGRLLWKDAEGNPVSFDATDIVYNPKCNIERVPLGQEPQSPFDGYAYFARTFNGLCGAVLVDHTHKKSSIMGLHIGGRDLDSTGHACAVLRKDVEKGISNFKHCMVEQQSSVSLESYGIELFDPAVYKKNPVFDTVDRIDHVEVIGTLKARKTPVSKVVKTPICDDVRKEFKLEVDWGAPSFKHDGDKRHGVRSLYKVLSTKQVLKHPELLQKAVTDYKSRVTSALERDLDFWKSQIHILDDGQIVNGTGVKFVNGMNMSTKFDAHLPGPKSNYAKQDVNGQWHFDEFVWTEFKAREELMKQGFLSYELLQQSLKNEATPMAKVELGKVRSFFMCGTPFQMILRKYLQTTCRFFCLNTPWTECAVGINPHSKSWDRLFEEVLKFRRLIATDFKNFDLTTLFDVLSEALDILFFPRRYVAEISEQEKNVHKCIKHAILFALCDINGDVMVLRGIIPSGINLTSILGCVVNSLNFRMAYYLLNISSQSFHERCILRTYGDDSFGSTNDKRFSVRNILYAFSVIGIYATDAHKNTVSTVDFYDVDDIEFLKRTGRFDAEFGVRVAPLLEGSRFKMLCCHVPTKTMTLEAVTGQCVDNFLLETAFLGRKEYESARTKIVKIVKKHNLERFCHTLDFTFDDRLKEWRWKYDETALVTEADYKSSFDAFRLVVSSWWNSQDWFGWTQETKQNNTCNLVGKIEVVEARASMPSNKNPHVLKGVGMDFPHYEMIEEQSGVETSQNVSFVEPPEELTQIIGGPMPEARSPPSDCSLGQFLSRPLKIAQYGWGNTTFAQNLDPWNELLNNKRISNRISNYRLFRGKCHIKIMVNGNGFYYGKLMVSYLPFSLQDNRTNTAETVPLNRITMSQLPKVFIDPTTSDSATMVLPFFYPMDYVDLLNGSVNRSLGRLHFYQIAQLQHANQDIAVTGAQLTVTVYAWFEDVELAGPMHLNATGITPQSSTENETVSKPVSQACTAVANAAHHLAPLPGIGKYALAIEEAARMTSTVASALGFSSPLDCVEPHRYQPRFLGNTCVANTTDSSMRLSLDVKQDTTIDPTTVGLGSSDELAFQKIAKIETFLNTFRWTTSQPAETLLMNYRVTPMQYGSSGLGIVNYPTAMCGVAIPFNYWNGSIKFKFQIICSANHKGRLAIVYDPSTTPDPVGLESNVVYMEIVDISQNREFEIVINNHQPRQWIRIPDDWFGLIPPPFSSSRFTTVDEIYNGTLSVHVLNNLTSPSSDPVIGAAIDIACYVSAGDDFQVANPSGRMSGYLDYNGSGSEGIEPQSGMSETMSSDITTSHDMPMADKQMRVYQGEKIESFRMLLKRYNAYMRVVEEDPFMIWTVLHQGFPATAGGSQGIPTGGPSNVVGFTLIQYLMGAFAGWKGSFRWKIISDDTYATINASRFDTSNWTAVPFKSTIFAGTTAFDAANATAALTNNALMNGAVMTHTSINPAIEVEIPYYSQYKFVAGKPRALNEAFLGAYAQELRVMMERRFPLGSVATSETYYVSAGEDFTCYFFTGWVPLTMFTVPPP